jgi:hypothetical protein
MLRRTSPWIVGLLALALAAPAGAGLLPFTGTYAVQMGPYGPISVTGTGVATVNGSGGGGHLSTLGLPAHVFVASKISIPRSFTFYQPVGGSGLFDLDNGAGSVSGAPLAGVLPFSGLARLCLFAKCDNGPVFNVTVPLSVVGSGGNAYLNFSINITVSGAPWTEGTAAAGTVTQMGVAHGPASGTSSTANASGVVRLVTPFTVSTNIGPVAYLPSFAIVTLHFVPEPGTLLLLSGGLVLTALGGRRMARRRP